MVGGVLGGIAEYFDQDPTIWRIGFLILLIATGLMPGILVYLIVWVVTPVAPTYSYTEVKHDEPATETQNTEPEAHSDAHNEAGT